jgi:hypothetical protein
MSIVSDIALDMFLYGFLSENIWLDFMHHSLECQSYSTRCQAKIYLAKKLEGLQESAQILWRVHVG